MTRENVRRENAEPEQRRPVHDGFVRLPLARPSVGVRLTAAAITMFLCVLGGMTLRSGVLRIGERFPGFLVFENGIVVAIARHDWGIEEARRILFAQVIGIGDRPIADVQDMHDQVAVLTLGSPVTYRFYKGGEIFASEVPVQEFTASDFLEVYAASYLVGLSFALSGLWTLWRVGRWIPTQTAFFVFCHTVAAVLFTAGHLYKPYWFADLFLVALCLLPATIFHFMGSFPEVIGNQTFLRRAIILLLYSGSGSLMVAFIFARQDLSLFLPLLYTTCLLTANALIICFVRLLIALLSLTDPVLRRATLWASIGMGFSEVMLGLAFSLSPLGGPVPTILLVVPLAGFPLITAMGLRPPDLPERAAAEGSSVRIRLYMLFLSAVQTLLLVAIALFWLIDSRERLADEFRLVSRQQLQIAQLLASPGIRLSDLGPISALLKTLFEEAYVLSARNALLSGDATEARRLLNRLRQHYTRQELRIEAQRRRIDTLTAGLVFVLIAVGLLQAVGFMAAIRRWLIRPVEQLAAATSVIATGDLDHRVRLDAGDELARLGRSINTMAQSISEIQMRIEVEREVRREAAAAARDAERRRLARELHDGALQDLGAVKLGLEGIIKRNPQTPLQQSIKDLVSVISDLRRVVDDLRPPDLSNATFREAVNAYARVRTSGQGINLQIDLPEQIFVPEWAARDAYRIVQEAISNAVRHGSPRHLGIYLYEQDGSTVLEISDDGSGFDLERTPLGGGIAGMRERAATLGGELEITSVPGEGTMVRLLLPPKYPMDLPKPTLN